MSRYATKRELCDDIIKERGRLEGLLASIPDDDKLVEVIDGMTTRDFIVHRTEWGNMAIRWYTEAKAGGTPEVPAAGYRWNQLKELNTAILERYTDVPLDEAQAEFGAVHDRLYELISDMTHEELFTRHVYDFTGTSDLATYMSSATAGHYRSAYRHINKWWRAQQAAQRT